MKKLLITNLLISTLSLQTWAQASNSNEMLDPWLGNPLASYVTKDQWKNIVREIDGKNSHRLKVQTLHINTLDTEACHKAKATIENMKNWRTNQDVEHLCVPNKEYPWASVTVVTPVTQDEVYYEINMPMSVRPQEEGLAQETFNLGLMGFGFLALLTAMPSSVTKWEKDKDGDVVLDKWKDNVSQKPVMDNDDWAINYIGHTVSGAAYYVIARHQNYSKRDAAIYTFLMSTFFWEYGIEAFAERPSIQDLIITPVLGSILGEYFYQSYKNIEANGGQVLGSKKLGNISMFLLNPAGTISQKINQTLDSRVMQSANTQLVVRQVRPQFGSSKDVGSKSTYLGIQLNFKFW